MKAHTLTHTNTDMLTDKSTPIWDICPVYLHLCLFCMKIMEIPFGKLKMVSISSEDAYKNHICSKSDTPHTHERARVCIKNDQIHIRLLLLFPPFSSLFRCFLLAPLLCSFRPHHHPPHQHHHLFISCSWQYLIFKFQPVINAIIQALSFMKILFY